MKLKRLCAAALVAAVGATVVGPLGVHAAGGDPEPTPTPTELGSTGTVNVEQGTINPPTTEIVDPENPDQTIDPTSPGINTNEDAGPLSLMRTTNYTFSTPLTNDGQTQFRNADPIMASLIDADGNPIAEPRARGALVQFGDIDSEATAGYTVTARITSQFANVDTANPNTLTGATLNFSNGMLTSQTDGKTAAEAGTLTPSFTVDDQSAVTVLTAANGQGKGLYTIEFGQSNDYVESGQVLGGSANPGTQATAVQLEVPGSTTGNMVVGATYNATITWYIARTA